MNKYEKLQAKNTHLNVTEEHMDRLGGLIVGQTVLINSRLTNTEKACILAEEAEHYALSCTDITDQSVTANRKQELLARKRSAVKLCPVSALVYAYEKGCANKYEIAELLDVTEEVVETAIKTYAEQNPDGIVMHNCMVTFYPTFGIFKIIE